MLDENHMSSNSNTTPVQTFVRVAHPLVGKAMPLQLGGHGFHPQCWQYAGLPSWLGRQRKICFLVFFAFLCFDFVPFCGDPQPRGGGGGFAGPGSFTPTPPPPSPHPPRKLAPKCRTVGAKGARRQICFNH